MVVRKTANNYSERMSRAWHTHGNSTTIENGERDPSGGERLRVFCRGCLGAVDGGDRDSYARARMLVEV